MPRYLALLSFFSLFACHTSPNLEKTKTEILALHEQERSFHFEKKAAEFAATLSENALMINKGRVNTASQEENQKRFESYFNSVEFLEWDDMTAPIVRLSDDGSMAYVVVEKKVTIQVIQEADTIQNSTQFAWVSIYEKDNGNWKITCNASTNQEPAGTHSKVAGDLNKSEMEVFRSLEQFSQAYRDADVETLAGMLTDQYIHSNSGGSVIRKDAWLNWISSRKKLIDSGDLNYAEYYNEDVVIETYGDAASVHGVNISIGTENEEPFEKKIAFTHTWVKENGAWKRASFHDTKID